MAAFCVSGDYLYRNCLIVIKEGKHNKNKKAKRLNSLSRINSTSASQTNGDAKILINTETAILKLENLSFLNQSPQQHTPSPDDVALRG